MHVSFGDRIAGALHAAIPRLGPMLARLESMTLSDEIANSPVCKPIYVCGLARAGSTLLLETLNAHSATTSHRYADYRMLWTPYWWNWLRARAPGLGEAAVAERAHGDRIRVSFESPEAFEEVFWMHFYPNLHQQRASEALGAEDFNPEFSRMLQAHISKLLAVRGASRYLAKANYHVNRIALLARMFPDARFVVPVREPVSHVASLVRQNRIFSKAGQDNLSVRRHLQRVGHFEFGLDKRATVLGDGASARASVADWAVGADAVGYARQWASVYEQLLDTLDARDDLRKSVMLVRYELLCSNAAESLRSVFAHCDLLDDEARALVAQRATDISSPDYYDERFDEATREAILDVTRVTARRLGYE